MSTELRLAHTSALDAATLALARALLADVFDGDFTAPDWEHALGGLHVLLWEGRDLIGHASVVQRRLLHGGRALRAGYVEGVGVRADRRRRGHGAAMMRALEPVVRGAYDLGALGSTEAAAAFYRELGWRQWLGPCSSLTPTGIVPTPADERLDLRPPVHGGARRVRRAHLRLVRRRRLVGAVSRRAARWQATATGTGRRACGTAATARRAR